MPGSSEGAQGVRQFSARWGAGCAQAGFRKAEKLKLPIDFSISHRYIPRATC